MEAWVISDHDDLIERVRRSLERPDGTSPYVRSSNVRACMQSGVLSATEDDAIFYATTQLRPGDFDALRQLRSRARGSLAVVAPMADSTAVLRAIRAGAEDFLDIDGDLAEEIAAFLGKARSDKSQPVTTGKIISVISGSVPSDASVLSVNLATAIARQSVGCTLLDFHRRSGDLALLLKLTPRHTLQDLMSQQHGIDQAMFEQALARHGSGVKLLAGQHSLAPPQHASVEEYQEVIKLARSGHPYVVVSSEDVLHLSEVSPLAEHDRIVFVMRLDLLSLHRAKQHLELLRRADLPNDRIEVVAMVAGHPGELPLAAVAKALGLPRVFALPDDPMASTVAINLGNPLVLESPTSPGAIAIKKLAARLCEIATCDATPTVNSRLAAAKAAAVSTVNAWIGRRAAHNS